MPTDEQLTAPNPGNIAPPPAPAPPASDTPPADQEPATPDLQSELDRWKAAARKHEDRAKANYQAVKELEELKKSQMSETERAVKEAEERGRTSAVSEFGQKIAAAELKAALAGLVADTQGLIEDLNLAKFVTDTGDVDTAAVTALKEKYAGLAPAAPATPPNLYQGRQGPPAPGQLGQAEADHLARTDPDALVRAKAEGRLNELLGIK